jgi:poly-gamma-glutamate synthesis protein (capsule biosynthesis protein)
MRLPAAIGVAALLMSARAAAADTPRPDTLELTFAGDIMFGGFFYGDWAPKTPEEGDALAEVHALLASDLGVANLETTLMREPPTTEADTKKMRFVAKPEHAAVLAKHGISVVSVANNHQLDMRVAGAAETMALLPELGLTAIGALRDAPPLVRVETVTVRGWKLGFIAATRVSNIRSAADEPQQVFLTGSDFVDQIVPAIEGAKADHDAIIVVLHWGTEYEDDPSSSQVKAAHVFVDAGAAAVIGTHPHVLQGIERYKGGVIAYSLGNFVFRNASEIVRQAGVLRIALGKTACLDRVEFHPTVMEKKPRYHPVPAEGKLFTKVAGRLIARSAALGTEWAIAGDRVATAGSCAKP